MAATKTNHGRALTRYAVEYRDTPFILKSGTPSHWYVDLRRGHSRPGLLVRTGRFLLGATAQESYDAVAGTGVDGGAVVSALQFAASERGHDVVAYRASDDRRGLTAEEDPKNGWGFRRSWVEDRRVLAVEGTLTSGGSFEDLVDLIRQAGGLVTAGAVVVDRSNGLISEVEERLGPNPETGEPVRLHALFRFDEGIGMLVPADGNKQ